MEAKDLTITFMVRKVKINRPWLETSMFNYKTIGISGLEIESWSNGTLDSKENKGQFPLLPTAMVVAKDVCIHFGEKSFDSSSTTTDHSTSVGISVVSFFYALVLRLYQGHREGFNITHQRSYHSMLCKVKLTQFLPHAHAQGVKQSVCPSVVVVVGTKIARSRVLGIYACTLLIAVKGLLVLQIVHFLFDMSVVYRPHPLF